MDIHRYQVEIRRHAMRRALKRNISPNQILNTIATGKITRIGKNYLRFKGRSCSCVGERKIG